MIGISTSDLEYFWFQSDCERKELLMHLLSIHVPSNKPKHFRRLVENLLATARNPKCFEVVVKIDDCDKVMQHEVDAIREELDINLTVVVSPKPKSYFHVWECMNEIYEASDPKYYFCWHINDEILIETKDWDKVLARYVDLFPDQIYRLKISPNKCINFYSIHEICWGADFPIVPRRWLEISGSWADYHGADSYQEGISFCLGKYAGIHRNIPLMDFIIGGDAPGENLSDEAEQKRNEGIIYHWDVGMSHRYQEDFLRRARRLELAALAHDQDIESFELCDDADSKLVLLNSEGKIITARSYSRNRAEVFAEHLWWVLKRHHQDELRGKPLWFVVLMVAGKIVLGAYFAAFLVFLALMGILESLYWALVGAPKKMPPVRFYQNIFVKKLPLFLYIPQWVARGGEFIVRHFPALKVALSKRYKRGPGEAS